MVWGAFIWFLVSLIVSVALAPKPPKPRAATIDDFDLPTAELDRPLPVVFGTKRITGPNVLWHGDLANTRIKQRSLFSSTTVGFRYHLGMHMGLGYGPLDKLTRIEVGDKLLWSGNVTASTNIDVDEPDLFGGDKKEGGMSGRIAVMMGEETQGANAYLASVIDSPMPAFRGMFGLVWERGAASGYVGNTPYLKPWAVTVTRILSGWNEDIVWYEDKAAIGDAMNPAHIVYQVLTDPRFGQGTIPAQINTDSFEAAADTLFDEGFGLNLLWNQSAKVDDFLQIVIDHIGGVLAIDPANNQYVLKLFRDDYDAETLDIFDASNIERMDSLQTHTWGETVNELTITYTDPDTLKSVPLTFQDLANIRNQNGVVSETIDRSGIADNALIRVAGSRELAQRSTPLWRARFRTNREFWDKTIGDVFKITWQRPTLTEVIFRVLKADGGALEDGGIQVEALEDIYARQGQEYSVVQPAADAPDPLPTPDAGDSNPNVLSINTNVPPEDPADGDRYLIPASPPATGAWAGHETDIAEWDEAAGQWFFIEVPAGVIIFDEETNTHYTTDGMGGVAPFESGGGGGGVASTGTPAAAARLTRSTDQEIPASSETAIVFDGQVFDTDDFWPNGSELSQAVANFTGQYAVSANVRWDSSTDGGRTLALRKNGTTIFASTTQASQAGLEQNVASLINLSVDDYVEAVVESGAAGSVDLIAGSSLPHLTIARLRTLLSPTLMRGATWVRSGAVIIPPVNDVAQYFAKPAFIHSITLLGLPGTGNATVDIWKAAIGDFPAEADDSIVGASAIPELDGEQTYFDDVLSGWDREIAAGDTLIFHLESASGLHQLFVQLEIRETE